MLWLRRVRESRTQRFILPLIVCCFHFNDIPHKHIFFAFFIFIAASYVSPIYMILNPFLNSLGGTYLAINYIFCAKWNHSIFIQSLSVWEETQKLRWNKCHWLQMHFRRITKQLSFEEKILSTCCDCSNLLLWITIDLWLNLAPL